jgi:hypothetical protein
MKLEVVGKNLVLTGTQGEFAEFIGFPDYDNVPDLRSALFHVAEDTHAVIDAPLCVQEWKVTGSWKDFAEIIGLPKASTQEEVMEATRSLHKTLFEHPRRK